MVKSSHVALALSLMMPAANASPFPLNQLVNFAGLGVCGANVFETCPNVNISLGKTHDGRVSMLARIGSQPPFVSGTLAMIDFIPIDYATNSPYAVNGAVPARPICDLTLNPASLYIGAPTGNNAPLHSTPSDLHLFGAFNPSIGSTTYQDTSLNWHVQVWFDLPALDPSNSDGTGILEIAGHCPPPA
jgi:hypothetical protein